MRRSTIAIALLAGCLALSSCGRGEEREPRGNAEEGQPRAVQPDEGPNDTSGGNASVTGEREMSGDATGEGSGVRGGASNPQTGTGTAGGVNASPSPAGNR